MGWEIKASLLYQAYVQISEGMGMFPDSEVLDLLYFDFLTLRLVCVGILLISICICIWMPTFKKSWAKILHAKKCASEHFFAEQAPPFPTFIDLIFIPKKPKVPTVTRDIIYGWARGLVGPLLLDCFAPSTFTHKADGGEICFFGKPAFVGLWQELDWDCRLFFFQTSQTDSETQELSKAEIIEICLEDFFSTKHSFQEFCCQILVGEVFDGFPCRQWSLDWRCGPLVPWGVLGKIVRSSGSGGWKEVFFVRNSLYFQGVMERKVVKVMKYNPLTTNMAPENQWLERCISYWNSPFLIWHVSFRGCILKLWSRLICWATCQDFSESTSESMS